MLTFHEMLELLEAQVGYDPNHPTDGRLDAKNPFSYDATKRGKIGAKKAEISGLGHDEIDSRGRNIARMNRRRHVDINPQAVTKDHSNTLKLLDLDKARVLDALSFAPQPSEVERFKKEWLAEKQRHPQISDQIDQALKEIEDAVSKQDSHGVPAQDRKSAFRPMTKYMARKHSKVF